MRSINTAQSTVYILYCSFYPLPSRSSKLSSSKIASPSWSSTHNKVILFDTSSLLLISHHCIPTGDSPINRFPSSCHKKIQKIQKNKKPHFISNHLLSPVVTCSKLPCLHQSLGLVEYVDFFSLISFLSFLSHFQCFQVSVINWLCNKSINYRKWQVLPNWE